MGGYRMALYAIRSYKARILVYVFWVDIKIDLLESPYYYE